MAELILSTRRQKSILDSYISYLDTEKGDKVVLFLHGNPTNSFLWRNIIPIVAPVARCLAPDLIGMGQSGKLPGSLYRFIDHYKYLCEWIEQMNLPKKIHFVIQDWGSGLGFHWCNQHRDRVASITFFEAIIGPFETWDDFPQSYASVFQALRSTEGETMVLKENMFVEKLLPAGMLTKLSAEEMENYLAPFKSEGEARRPTLTWPREIPIKSDGPADVVKFASDYNMWLSTTDDVPKLYIHAEPGFFSERILKMVKEWPNIKVAKVKGHHFAQEDSPEEIGTEVKKFVSGL